MKLPLRVMRRPQEQGFEYANIVDADGRISGLFAQQQPWTLTPSGYEDYEARVAEMEAIVAAVNGQAAQEERIKALVDAIKVCLDRTHSVHSWEAPPDAMKCSYPQCQKIAAAIRAAGGE